MNIFIKFFYKGCDRLFFFSKKHVDDALNKKVIDPSKLVLIDFGGDLGYFNKMMSSMAKIHNDNGHFITFGKENRDYITLIEAFKRTPNILDIYTSYINGDKDYQNQLRKLVNEYSNINIYFTNNFKTVFPTLFERTIICNCVVISTFEMDYSVGLTQLIEAMAMGLAVISTDNPYYPIDIEKEGIGIKVKYSCIEEWVNAIHYIYSHPAETKEMGRKSRVLSEKKYNIDNTIMQISEQLMTVSSLSLGYSKIKE